jgi:hypothetical protein
MDTLNVGNAAAVERTLQSIRTENAWRMPADIKQRMDAAHKTK